MSDVGYSTLPDLSRNFDWRKLFSFLRFESEKVEIKIWNLFTRHNNTMCKNFSVSLKVCKIILLLQGVSAVVIAATKRRSLNWKSWRKKTLLLFFSTTQDLYKVLWVPRPAHFKVSSPFQYFWMKRKKNSIHLPFKKNLEKCYASYTL